MKGLHGLGLVLLEQLGQNILKSVLANSDSVEVSVVQKKGAGWRKKYKHVMNVFAVWWGLNQFWRKILCGRNCMNSAKEQQHNFKRNSWGMPFFHHFFVLDTMATFSCEFLLKFWCIPFACPLKFFWIPFASFAVFMHFWENFRNFLWISYAFLMYDFLMQFLCSFYSFIRFWQKCMKL